MPALDDFKPRAVKGIFLGMTEHVANGKAVMYTDTGYIDINSAIYEAVGDLSVETLPADWQPQQLLPPGASEQQQVQAAPQPGGERQEAPQEAGSFEDDGRVASWMCPACRGKHRPHSRVPGQCRLATKPEEHVERPQPTRSSEEVRIEEPGVLVPRVLPDRPSQQQQQHQQMLDRLEEENRTSDNNCCWTGASRTSTGRCWTGCSKRK